MSDYSMILKPSPVLSAEETQGIFVSRDSCSGGWGHLSTADQLIPDAGEYALKEWRCEK